MLRKIHKARCFLWRQNNPVLNYPPLGSGGGGGVFLEEVSRSRQRKRRRYLFSVIKIIFSVFYYYYYYYYYYYFTLGNIVIHLDTKRHEYDDFKCCLSVHVDNYAIIFPTKCTSFY
jgi:hypothetical protein